jgi:hypothetical protein
MGGYGSTRWIGHSKKICVESCLELSVTSLKHQGVICNTSEEKDLIWREYVSKEIVASVRYTCRQIGSDWKLTLSYTANKKYSIVEQITITYEKRFMGNKAPVFLCPLCRRPYRILYSPPGAAYFACRKCYDLTYLSSQKAHRYDRGQLRVYGKYSR